MHMYKYDVYMCVFVLCAAEVIDATASSDVFEHAGCLCICIADTKQVRVCLYRCVFMFCPHCKAQRALKHATCDNFMYEKDWRSHAGRDRSGGLTSPLHSMLAAAPALFAHENK